MSLQAAAGPYSPPSNPTQPSQTEQSNEQEAREFTQQKGSEATDLVGDLMDLEF